MRPASRFATRQTRGRRDAGGRPARRLDPGRQDARAAQLGAAPDFTRTQLWFNTPGDRPLTLAGLRGHVVLVDFWTYTCINCMRTLPFLKGLYATYHRYGLEVVGVETPEFTFEQEAEQRPAGDRSDALNYPVVQDNVYGTWNAYQNQYWPAEYLIDAHGQVRHTQFGEGHYGQDEAAVRQLLYEAGARNLPATDDRPRDHALAGLATPETYLDPERSQGFAQPLEAGTHSTPGSSCRVNEFGLHGDLDGDQPVGDPGRRREPRSSGVSRPRTCIWC